MTALSVQRLLLGILLTLAAAAQPAAANTQVLYDASIAPNELYMPTTPGWLSSGLYFLDPTVTTQGTELTPLGAGNGDVGGYSNYRSSLSFPPLQVHTGNLVNPAFPVLSADPGYTLDLGFRVNDESHGSDNRAGFSITLIGNDLRGVEIGFQHDSIFAQETGPAFFSRAEATTDSFALGQMSMYNRWQLQVSGDRYVLWQGGSQILSGSLRNYSSYTGLGEEAYRTPNFLFFGDNTTSARSDFAISYAAIVTAPVPEPSSLALLLGGLLMVGAALRRRRA